MKRFQQKKIRILNSEIRQFNYKIQKNIIHLRLRQLRKPLNTQTLTVSDSTDQTGPLILNVRSRNSPNPMPFERKWRQCVRASAYQFQNTVVIGCYWWTEELTRFKELKGTHVYSECMIQSRGILMKNQATTTSKNWSQAWRDTHTDDGFTCWYLFIN